MKIGKITTKTEAKSILNYSTSNPFTHVLSIQDKGDLWVPRPQFGCEVETLQFDDLFSPTAASGPQVHHIRQIISWAQSLPESSHALVHCVAGVSRSTAAALISSVVETGNVSDSVDHVWTIRPQAIPNPLMVWIADKLLGLDGRLFRASEEAIENTGYIIGHAKTTSQVYIDHFEEWWRGLDKGNI